MSKFDIAAEAVLVIFPVWFKRKMKIALLKVRIKALEALQIGELNNLTEAVTETGRVRVADVDGIEHVLEIKHDRADPKEARLGPKEILEAVDSYDSGIKARLEKVIAKALKAKAEHNASMAPMLHNFEHRPADERDSRVKLLAPAV